MRFKPNISSVQNLLLIKLTNIEMKNCVVSDKILSIVVYYSRNEKQHFDSVSLYVNS